MKIVVACPIRISTGEENRRAQEYIRAVKAMGHEVFSYWDTLQEACPTGADILEKHLQAVRECEELHVFWKESSRGTHWEVGTAVALNKRIVIVGIEGEMPTGQSYLTALCQRPEVDWRVEGIPRPEIIG